MVRMRSFCYVVVKGGHALFACRGERRALDQHTCAGGKENKSEITCNTLDERVAPQTA
jgi:hypothetical protein